jgi:hypothetical protein
MSERKFNLSNYPLSWPDGWKRTPGSALREARFLRNHARPTIMQGLDRVLRELATYGSEARRCVDFNGCTDTA